MINISDFLIKCAGADLNILKKCTEKERTKFIGIGSTLILTAILASFSGGYAIFSTFQSVPLAIILGIFWGIVIFSLDRYIVTSIDKSGVWWVQLLTALPRLLMALILAITISKPIELRLFQNAINKAMGEISSSSITTCENEWNRKRNKLAEDKGSLENIRKQKTEEIYNRDGIYNQLSTEQISILSRNKQNLKVISSNNNIIRKGTTFPIIRSDEYGNPIRVTRRTIAAKKALAENIAINRDILTNNLEINKNVAQKNARKDTLKGQVIVTEKQYSKQIDGIQTQIDDHNSKRSATLARCTKEALEARDMPAQLQALAKITSENESVGNASLMITMLFIILETAPVVVKLLSSTGVYEECIKALEHDLIMQQKIRISNLNDEINTIQKISIEKNKNRLSAELKGNEELLNAIALAQADIAKIAVKKWRKEEIDKITNDGTGHIINNGVAEKHLNNTNAAT